MKLYTEEQLIKAIKLAQECESDCGGVYFGYTETEVLGELTPIELPSDEDEEKAAFSLTKNLQQHMGFNIGAKWMRDKIGGNK